MAYRVVPGAGLRTSWDDAPRVRVTTEPDAPTVVEVEFFAAADGAAVTTLTFTDVFWYRWEDFDADLPAGNRHDFKFALIEILDSEKIEGWAAGPHGMPGVLRRSMLHHFRIGFDDHGTYDVICCGLAVTVRSASGEVESHHQVAVPPDGSQRYYGAVGRGAAEVAAAVGQELRLELSPRPDGSYARRIHPGEELSPWDTTDLLVEVSGNHAGAGEAVLPDHPEVDVVVHTTVVTGDWDLLDMRMGRVEGLTLLSEELR